MSERHSREQREEQAMSDDHKHPAEPQADSKAGIPAETAAEAAMAEHGPDHPMEAWRETSRVAEASRSAPVPAGAGGADDPLAEKHKARFDRDFRTLDYRQLSQDEADREAERRRRARERSSWHPARAGAERCPPLKAPQFSHFGGSFISAEVIRGKSDVPVPDMMPTLPGETPEDETPQPARSQAKHPFGAPDPHGRTPAPEARKAMPQDPLVEKYRAERFEADGAEPGRSGPGDVKPSGGAHAIGRAFEEPEEPDAGELAAFRVNGVSGPVHGAPAGHAAGRPAAGAPAAEPRRLDAPRGGDPDDLTRISGIGPAVERLLFDIGIFHLDQIAALSDEEIAWLEERLGLAGRVASERWVEQAKTLAGSSGT
ncbi:hypothetical protein [Jiella sp. M17.18]|uniref:hypothetical protein n=1 Tax=Jiella sp. M17.18 TaxID=3234247 RepID=UPI0034E02BDD